MMAIGKFILHAEPCFSNLHSDLDNSAVWGGEATRQVTKCLSGSSAAHALGAAVNPAVTSLGIWLCDCPTEAAPMTTCLKALAARLQREGLGQIPQLPPDAM